MKRAKIRETAQRIVEATASMPSARAIRELMVEYVSQRSQERRLIILLDVYSCLMQDLGNPTACIGRETFAFLPSV